MAKEFQAVLEREATLGLGQRRIRLHSLYSNESAVRELGDDILKEDRHQDHRKNCVPVRRWIGKCERVSERGSGYWFDGLFRGEITPGGEDAVELVLKQAESLSNR